MFDSFLVALNAIMPTFLLLAFGYFLKHKNFVSSEFLKQTNTLTFKFFLPFLLFNNIYKTEITEAIDGMTFTIAVGSLLLLFAVLCIVVSCASRNSAASSFRDFFVATTSSSA